MSATKTRPRPFGYQCEKMNAARSTLMAPHYEGEEQDIAHSFQSCWHAFYELNMDWVKDQDALTWIEVIKRTMDASNVRDPDGRGKYFHRARQLSIDEKREYSHAVNQLAHWFAAEHYGRYL